MKNYICSG